MTPIFDQLKKDCPAIAQVAAMYFATYEELDPLELDIYVGVYMAYDQEKRRPKKVTINKADYSLSYALPFDKRPLVFEVDQSRMQTGGGTQAEGGPDGHVGLPWRYDSSTYKPIETEDDWAMQWAVHMPIKGDAVYDDEAELWRNSNVLSAAWGLQKLSEEMRLELYGSHLDAITERPFPGVADKSNSKSFLRSLATDYTYDDKGFYFEKWKDNKPRPADRYRHSTEEYKKRYWEELFLVEDKFYIWVTDESGAGTMYQLSYVDKKLERSHYTGLIPPKLQALQEKNIEARRKAIADKKKPPARLRALFCYTREGVKTKWKAREPRTYELSKDARAPHLVVDPRELVKDANAGTEIADALNFGDDFDWFVEMVAEKFPWRFYQFDLKKFDDRWRPSGGPPADRDPNYLRQPFHDAAKKALSKTKGGPLSEAAKAQVVQWLDRPGVLVVPQGLDLGGGRKFIGFAENLAYMRNMQNGHVEVMSDEDLLMNLALGKFWGGVAESTAWIVPVAEFLAVAALIAVSAGTAAPGAAGIELSASAARTWVVRYAAKEAINRAVWEAAKRLAPHFAAMVALAVLKLFDDPKLDNTTGNRWRRFAQGFFEGYLIQTMYDHLFKKILTTVVKGPKEYRTMVAVRKLHAAVDKVYDKIKKFDDELDEPAMRQAVKNFQLMATHLIRGCALLIAAVYHVPHEEAKPALDVLGRGPDEEPPSQSQWEAEAGAAMAALAKKLEEAIATAGSMDEVLADVLGNGKLIVAAGGLLYGFSTQTTGGVTKIAGKGGKVIWGQIKKRKKLFLFTSIAAVGLLAGLKRDDIPKLIDDIGEMLKDVGGLIGHLVVETVSGFPGKDPNQAELYGKLIGNLIGGFLLDREMGKLKEKLGIEKDSFMDKTFDNNFKHGMVMPIIKLVFKRYLSLYDQLVKKNIMGASKGHGELAAVFSDVQKKELEARGMSHLLDFQSEQEKGMSLKSLGMAALKLHTILEEDTKEFLLKKYDGNIQRYKDDLKAAAALSAELGLSGIVEDNLDLAWHRLSTHMRLALKDLTEGLRIMFSPFKPDGHFSWIELVSALGLDVGNVNVLRKELFDPRKAELATIGIAPAAGK